MNQFLYTAGILEGSDCISSAVSLGDFVYVSAQTGQGDTIEEQTLSACKKLKDVLSDFGLEFRHTVKYTVYLTDMRNKEVFLSIYKNYVEAPYPAMTIVEVQALDQHAKVAIEAFAINTVRYEKSCSNECSTCSENCAKN